MRLTSKYDVQPIGPWTLFLRSFREKSAVPAESTGGDQNLHLRHIQILGLSHYAGYYVAAVGPPEPVSSGPESPDATGQSSSGATEAIRIREFDTVEGADNFVSLVGSKFGGSFIVRAGLSVKSGHAYTVGDYAIRVGEIRQGVGAQALLRGIVMEIRYTNDFDRAEDAKGMITEIWRSLNLGKAKECIVALSGDKEVDKVEEIKLWCEVLRLRSSTSKFAHVARRLFSV